MERLTCRPGYDPRAGQERPVDLIYRYQPGSTRDTLPASPSEAQARLHSGNRNLCRFIRACAPGGPQGALPVPVLLDPHEVGQGPGRGGFPRQEPFALVLGCADARTPAEITFCQSFNDLFNIRVAGNVLGRECAGSVRYAIENFAPASRPLEGNPQSLRAMIALGHLNCGAVKAAVGAFQDDLSPAQTSDCSVGAILQQIDFPALMVAVEVFDSPDGFGPRASREKLYLVALCDLVVNLNAAWTAHQLQSLIPPDPVTREGLEACFGIFDPRDCAVKPCSVAGAWPDDSETAFSRPPRDLQDLRDLARRMVTSQRNPTRLRPEKTSCG